MRYYSNNFTKSYTEEEAEDLIKSGKMQIVTPPEQPSICSEEAEEIFEELTSLEEKLTRIEELQNK
jgi:hypothetical protein